MIGRRAISILLAAALLLDAGCRGADTPAEEAAGGEVGSATSSAEAGQAPASDVIETPLGRLVVTEVEFSDDDPPGCTDEPSALVPGGCSRAIEGYHFVTVWLEAVPGTDHGEVGRRLFEATEDVWLVGEDGVRSGRAGAGIRADRLFVLFVPPVSHGSLSLLWSREIDLRP